ncbi:MAG TPA: DUF3800 domain-containing protein [Candidatus Saccharimonadales bacterium]|nr:DUF3800 domain-containing protein [Candidatus Saccharimonadales bacterium]
MLVFIDDSGDAGFKLEKGSSKHFVIACVIFDDNLDAEETALKIKRLRRTLKWRDDHEFKFNKTNKEIRLTFLNEVKGCSFRIRAIVADKSIIRSPELRTNKTKFYNYMIKEVLSKSDGSIKNGSIRLDGHEDRSYKKAATTYFKQQANPRGGVIKDMKFVNSKNDNLIQLADMVAGSILRTTQSSKTDNAEYLKVIKKRVEDIWHFK